MIFVSGTKRSGTSMWMQVFAAAGYHILGKAFPRGWDRTLKDANPDGFYESLLRQGIYYRTNPHPTTGKFFLPQEVENSVVKVFIPGVIRSERSYIETLVANVREWRDYSASLDRLYAMEDTERTQVAPDAPAPFRFPPALEWWMENFALVRDIHLRDLPAIVQTYDQVVSDPQARVAAVVERVGGGDVEAAVAAVKLEHRTQSGGNPTPEGIEPEVAQVFDDLYGAVSTGGRFAPILLDRLNELNRQMIPRLRQLQGELARSEMSRRSGRSAEPVAGLE